MKIGILTHDNGEFDSYLGFFSDPDRLKEVVKKLNAERVYSYYDRDPVTAGVIVEELLEIPETIDDAYLDKIVSLIEDGAGVEIETSAQRLERLAEEAEEEILDQPQAPAPGQTTITDILKED